MSKHTTEPTTVDQVLEATSGWRPIPNDVGEQVEVFLEVRGDKTLVIVSSHDDNVVHLEPAAAVALADELRAFAATARSIVIDRAVSE